MCLEGRISGAEKFENAGAILDDAEKPLHGRIKLENILRRNDNICLCDIIYSYMKRESNE